MMSLCPGTAAALPEMQVVTHLPCNCVTEIKSVNHICGCLSISPKRKLYGGFFSPFFFLRLELNSQQAKYLCVSYETVRLHYTSVKTALRARSWALIHWCQKICRTWYPLKLCWGFVCVRTVLFFFPFNFLFLLWHKHMNSINKYICAWFLCCNWKKKILRPEIHFFSIHPSLLFHCCLILTTDKMSDAKYSSVCGLPGNTKQGTGNCSCADNHCFDTIYFGPIHKT